MTKFDLKKYNVIKLSVIHNLKSFWKYVYKHKDNIAKSQYLISLLWTYIFWILDTEKNIVAQFFFKNYP